MIVLLLAIGICAALWLYQGTSLEDAIHNLKVWELEVNIEIMQENIDEFREQSRILRKEFEDEFI